MRYKSEIFAAYDVNEKEYKGSQFHNPHKIGQKSIERPFLK